jgi:hypothetical protein
MLRGLLLECIPDSIEMLRALIGLLLGGEIWQGNLLDAAFQPRAPKVSGMMAPSEGKIKSLL